MGCAHWFRAGLAAVGLWLGAAQAAPPATDPPADMDIRALAGARASVVGIQVKAADGAPSLETLGQYRSGSGVVIDADGLILTIDYLMRDADTVDIVTADHLKLPARAVAYDVATGVGLVRPLLPLHGARPVAFGHPARLNEGDWVVAISGGRDAEVQMARLVGRRPFSGSWEYHLDHALYTAPPMGNHTGAPLFNLHGELLGVGSLLLDVSGGNDIVPGNLFVPVDLLVPLLAELRQTGSSRASHRPWLGLTLNDQEGRVEVIRVARGSPAEAAALAPGDLLLAVDGVGVASLATFYKKLWDRATPDAEIELTVQQRTAVRTLRLRGIDRASLLAQPARAGGI